MVLQNTTGNPLSAGSLSLFAAMSLPRPADGQQQLRNAYDVVALVVHAGMLAVGFQLVGLGEEQKIATPSDASGPRPLPAEWNASSSSSYAFSYAHAQSSTEYLVKVTRLGSKAVIFAIEDGSDQTSQFEATAQEFISESALPASPLPSEHVLPDGVDESSVDETYRAAVADAATRIREIFISDGRLDDLGALLKLRIIQKLASSLTEKDSANDASAQSQTAASAYASEGLGRDRPGPPQDPTRTGNRGPDPASEDNSEPDPARPHPLNDPLAAPRQPLNRPLPEPIPGFEDEFEMNPRRPGLPHLGSGSQPGAGPRHPLDIGHDDLYPPGLGPHDPLRPSFAGGIGPGHSGMHPAFSPDNPFFDLQVPPGARFDPVGPGSGGPRDPSGRGRRGGGGGYGAPPNPFGGFGGSDFI